MSDATHYFPKDFKWGTASSSHQVEGDNTNNQWWLWEQVPGHIVEGYTSGPACDWWNNAESDFDRMADMGLNAHRLSLEWSRIEPREGHFDQNAIDRYRQMLLGLRRRGIEPMVTLHHFSNPIWLEQKRAWEHTDVIGPLFERYTETVVKALGDLCDLWCPINEPNVFAVMGYLSGGRMPPGESNLATTISVARNMLVAHAVAYEVLHREQPLARVGIAHHMRVFQGLNPRNPLDTLVAKLQDTLFNESLLDALIHGRWHWMMMRGAPVSARRLRKTLDWIGLNYYTRQRAAFDRTQGATLYGTIVNTPGAIMSDYEFGEIYPEGLLHLLRRLARFKLPIYITENGLPDADDDQRPAFLARHIRAIWQAVQFCYDVRGYYHWTFVDNFEWGEGWRMRFGLYALDVATQERTLRPSGALMRDIVKANALSSEIVRRHVPELLGQLFP
jgi:beta-glucosidase